MILHRTLPLLATALLLGACAGKPVRTAAAPDAVVAPSACSDPDDCPAPAASAAATVSLAPAEDARTTDAPPPEPAIDTASTDAEDDFAALYGSSPGAANGDGSAPAYDPWETYNRRMHRFNLAVDRGVARPLATAYVRTVPRVARTGVSNFFSNLRSPLTLVNQLLQGRPDDAWDTLGRFLMNSTLGLGGLFDPAGKAMVPRRSEDFGQTLGVWGWRDSRYVELPFFGPRTVRDVFGLAGDTPLSPLRRIEMDKLRLGLQGLQLVDTRVQLLSLDDIRDSAVDEYALTRDAWLQRRNYQIERDMRGDRQRHEDDEQTTIPVDAMPMPDWGR
ncbi:MlaA family lipoprotein [Stenotrophomonas mori]|uniref:VacJ family lipoprotein n=1 Tax=Stenotrophomonas mori TaxID=2871096 RepID=A0ABT0SHL2_9GAMM|nr:VacJ family lipoprotein [Stenotrophomonas mori]MCL7714820.1 VacJ family lipoprotein [Stenotrophomonas mori]